MGKMTIVYVFMGVLGAARVIAIDESKRFTPNGQPMGLIENDVGQGRVGTPEVVLQLKYDQGELNKIYLTQFRKEEAGNPSVLARPNLCADLCHAGLGGEACGPSCPQMIPVGLHSALEHGTLTGVVHGQPRVSVCPALCDNHLGVPLCNCTEGEEPEHAADWTAVCSAFCLEEYTLGGCPTCEAPSPSSPALLANRVLNTSVGWQAWCDIQCSHGHGGAACNCDRNPFQ